MIGEYLIHLTWVVALPLIAILIIVGLWVRAYSNRRREMNRRR